MLKAGSYAGRDPSTIDLSSDAGNLVTGLKRTWTSTQGVGHGTSDYLNCVPNCANSASTPEATTITLTDPQGGHFTKMTKQRGGGTQSFTYPGNWALGASRRPTPVIDSVILRPSALGVAVDPWRASS